MFELSEVKDYWAIVSLASSIDEGRYREILIIKSSKDCADNCVFDNGITADDNGLDTKWAKDHLEGVYRLTVEPIFDGDGVIEDIKVTSITCLYTF